MLKLNIFPDHLCRYFISHRPYKVSVIPQLSSPEFLFDLWKFFKYFLGRYTLHYLYNPCWCIAGWGNQKQMNMIFHDFHSINSKTIALCYTLKNLFKPFSIFPRSTSLRYFGTQTI